MDQERIRRVVGTAGHIDHGKSTLVRALTGTDPDRLPEEKKRGITIDLGFANLVEGEVQIGFVDVPGHERFVRNMLAGAGGIDAVMLVIAADESVMPQTREHFDICRLLDVQTGVVVITKADLVDDEMLELVRLEAVDLVQGSFLEGAPVVAVSSTTNQGIPELRNTLIEIVRASAAPAGREHIARLPVDRAFIVRGFGTVVTGTLVSGILRRDEDLVLLPEGRPVRARNIEVHGGSREEARAGERTSINIADVSLDQVSRGQMLVPPDTVTGSGVSIVELQLLDTSPPLRDSARVHLHLHAAEVLATVRLFGGRKSVEPGESAVVQLRMASPVVAVAGDRFVVRRYSPVATIGGGVVLDPHPPKLKLSSSESQFEPLRAADLPTRMQWWSRRAGKRGLSLRSVRERSGLTSESILRQARGAAGILRIGDAGPWVHSDTLSQIRRDAMDLLETWFRENRMTHGMPKRTFLQKLLPAAGETSLVNWILNDLSREKIAAVDGDLVTVPGRRAELAGAEGELATRIEKTFRDAGLQPPNLGEVVRGVAQKSKIVEGVIGYLVRSGALIRLADGLWLHRDVVAEAKAKLSQHRGANIDVAFFKELFGLSRKVAIPLLEHFDSSGATRRIGDSREVL